MTSVVISAPVMMEPENKSTSTFATTVVPYYGSREPKQSIIETDRVIFQMMDDIQSSELQQGKLENIQGKRISPFF